MAAELDRGTFTGVLEKIADIKYGTDKPQRLIPLCRYGNSEHIKTIISAMDKWDNWYTYAASGRSAIIVARGAIMLNESREAMMYAEKCKLLRVYAGMRNMDEDVLRDTKLADFGLGENGCKRFDLGSTVVEATVGQDLSTCLYDTKAQKIVKSLPKKGADADKHAAASAELSDLKKNLKKVVKSRNDILFERFLDGKTQEAAAGIGSYTKNPVLRRDAELIVWNQKKNTFILTKNGAVDCDGNTYIISDGAPVIDWRRHDIGMDNRFEITSFSIGRSLTRKVNHIVAYLDRITVYALSGLTNLKRCYGGVLHKTEKLPARFKALYIGEPDDTAWLALYQPDKTWAKAVREKLDATPELITPSIAKMAEIINGMETLEKSVGNRAGAVAQELCKGAEAEALMALYQALKEKGHLIVKKLDADEVFNTCLEGGVKENLAALHPIEALVVQNLKYTPAFEKVLGRIVEGVPYAGTEEVCAPRVLAFIAYEYIRQYDPESVKYVSMYS